MGRYLDIAQKALAKLDQAKGELEGQNEAIKNPQAVSTLEEIPAPSRWSRLADSGLHHNDVEDHADVIFLFTCELILDPSKAREDCRSLPSLWAHYALHWKERLPREAFTELERRYRRGSSPGEAEAF